MKYAIILEISGDESQNITDDHMDISHLKILVAEDNPMNIFLMKKLLAKWQIVPDFATNGVEAIEAFNINNYDLILMDINMPIMDGYEATNLIRNSKDEHKSKVEIIALTASIAQAIRTKIKDAGINDFVCKPFEPEELKIKLEGVALKLIS